MNFVLLENMHVLFADGIFIIWIIWPTHCAKMHLPYLSFQFKVKQFFHIKSVQSQIVLLFLNQFKIKQCFHFVSKNTILKNLDDVKIYMKNLFQRMQQGTINSFPVVN